MFDYQKPDRGWCGDPKRGAAMGRASDLEHDTTAELKVRRVHLDGDYDAGGTYWGAGEPLFCVFEAEGEKVTYLRAKSFDEAKGHFPNASWAAEVGPSEEDIDDMFEGYLTCALWISNDESDEQGGEPLDANYTTADIAEETRAALKETVTRFAREYGALIASCIGHDKCDWALAGHDLWLTHNGHGAGFGDGDWPDPADDILYEAAQKLSDAYLYVGDDGKIHCD